MKPIAVVHVSEPARAGVVVEPMTESNPQRGQFVPARSVLSLLEVIIVATLPSEFPETAGQDSPT